MKRRTNKSEAIEVLGLKKKTLLGTSMLVGSLFIYGAYAASYDSSSPGTSTSGGSVVQIPTTSGAGGSSQGQPGGTVTPAAKPLYTLSDFLWKKATAADDDTQGKFLEAVAADMKSMGIATQPSLFTSPHLSVSDDKRYLQTDDGKPFAWMSDTSWMWIYRLYMPERREYLDARKDQGFNVLMFQMLTGGYGQKDLAQNAMFNTVGLKTGPAISRSPNVKFWSRARRAVEDISRAGVVPAMVLTWGAQVRSGFFDKDAAYDYGRLIGRAFGDLNIIFVLGGDTIPTEAEKVVWAAMAKGLRDGEPHRNLITFHPASGSSTDYFPDADWLDIDAMQSGHGRFRPRTKAIGEAIYQRYIANRKRPLVDLESGYEHIVDNLYATEPDVTRTVSDDKRLDAYDIRVRAYQQWVSGAMGYGYGEVDSVQSWRPGLAPYWPSNEHWRDALRIEGAGDLRYFQQLRAEVGQVLVPVPEWSELASNIQDYYRTLTACDKDRNTCIAYDTDGTVVTLPVSVGRFKQCVWMDPRTGARYACAPTVPAKGNNILYTPPVVLNSPLMVDGQWYRNKNDWVLILKS